MDRLRRLLYEEAEEQRKRHTKDMRKTYRDQLKEIQQEQERERASQQKRKMPVSCVSQMVICPIERFLSECRKTKTKEITLANHNRRKQRDEPIIIRSRFMYPASSAGKRVRGRHDWFWFGFYLNSKNKKPSQLLPPK